MFRFETTSAGNPAVGAATAVNSITIVAAGAVADFDLAYANPTQSTIVQNRSGSGDGTADGGVSQITKLEAVNTNKLNVGGTTPRVGIGLDAAVTPSSTLHVKSGSAGTITTEAFADDLIIENSDHVGLSLRCPDAKDGFILFQSATNDRVARISAEYNGGSDNLKFDVDDATALTIDSAGMSHFTTNVAADTEVIRVENLDSGRNAFASFYRSATENGRLGTAGDHLTLEAQNGKSVRVFDDGGNGMSIADGGIASFSAGIDVAGGRIKLGTTGELDKQLIAGQLPASGPSAGNTFTFNFTFAGTYGMALITLDICGGIYETAAGRYTFHVNSKAGSGLTTALSKAATTVFEHNLGSFTFADSGATNNKFSIAVTRTETSENWSSGWGSYALDVTSNARALTLDSVAIS